MKAAEFIFQSMANQGTKQLFFVPGQQIDALVKNLQDTSAVTPILCASEGGAGFMADGAVRFSKKPGFLASIGGPGLANVVPALLTAYLEQYPLVVISGDNPQKLAAWPSFQNATDIGSKDLAWAGQLTKYACRVTDIAALPSLLTLALEQALSYPYGPVLLQVPNDVFDQEVDAMPVPRAACSAPAISPEGTQAIAAVLAQEKGTCFFLGSTGLQTSTQEALLAICESSQIPVITTLDSKGIIPETHPLNYGVLGYGSPPNKQARKLLQKMERVIILGVKLSDRNTDNWDPSLFNTNKRLFYIGAHLPEAIRNAWDDLTFIQADPDEFLQQVYHQLGSYQSRAQAKQPIGQAPKGPISVAVPLPGKFVHIIRRWLPARIPVFVDAGSWKETMGKFWTVKQPGTFFMSPDVGSMGWAIGAGLGAAIQNQPYGAVIFTGDGSMGMHGLELATAVRYNIPVTVFVLNNGTLQSVKDRHTADPKSLLKLPEINWKTFGESIGMTAFRIETAEALIACLENLQPAGQYLIELVLRDTPEN
ncbi:MAG: thiamine pyrophosphate-binding protein [Lewinellaceae bacterium]|nr:thiamine pyrophosphate-binding protein [Lewinellaceae bacterium]